MNACYLSNNGIGDNLYSIGALRYLLNFYKSVYFVCRDIYLNKIKQFFIDTNNIICIPFSGTKKLELQSCKKIIDKYRKKNDIFISGRHLKYNKSKITNKKFLNAIKKLPPPKYTINYDTINNKNYDFISKFYRVNGMNLDILFNNFQLPKTRNSKEFYNLIKDYKIIFLQTKSSGKNKLNIDNLIENNIHKEDTIMICNDENIYDYAIEQTDSSLKKKELCNHFIKGNFLDYLDTIINSQEIYIIDSCFVGIILPLLKTNKLNAKIVRIITRDKVNSIKL